MYAGAANSAPAGWNANDKPDLDDRIGEFYRRVWRSSVGRIAGGWIEITFARAVMTGKRGLSYQRASLFFPNLVLATTRRTLIPP